MLVRKTHRLLLHNIMEEIKFNVMVLNPFKRLGISTMLRLISSTKKVELYHLQDKRNKQRQLKIFMT